MKLAIVIPALNEEQSIKDIIERTITAKEYIIENSPVTEVNVTVVSDGSTDNTVKYASEYEEVIDIIVFEENKGYGAAIKKGWEESDAELLGFLDADGTCDPLFFAKLCSKLIQEDADIILGGRLNKESQMPFIRRLGNTLFALLLSALSRKRVRDTASGMRVVQSKSLLKIYPLPDRLHFTPAMSARAMMSDYLSIKEVDMPYKEREGESKLHVIKDGVRFLSVIFETILLYKPQRILLIAAFICFLLALVIMVYPILFYVHTFTIEEWMIYRFIIGELLGVLTILLISSAYLGEKMVWLSISQDFLKNRPKNWLNFIFEGKGSWIYPILLIVVSIFLVFDSFVQRVTEGITYEHWSRYIVMSFLSITSFILIITKLLKYILGQIVERMRYFSKV